MVQWAAELEPLVSALQKRQEILSQQFDKISRIRFFWKNFKIHNKFVQFWSKFMFFVICPRYESRQKLVGQETENEMVRKEFEALRSDSCIYKAVGPVLVKQDTEEAKSNVEKRIDFIKQEIERVNKVCEKLENEAEEARKELVEKQQAIQAKQDAALAGGEAAAWALSNFQIGSRFDHF